MSASASARRVSRPTRSGIGASSARRASASSASASRSTRSSVRRAAKASAPSSSARSCGVTAPSPSRDRRSAIARGARPAAFAAATAARVRACAAAGGEGVPCEVRGGPERPVLPQRLDAGPVQIQPFGGEQVVRHRLGEQRVPERVAPLTPRLEHVVLDGGSQARPQRRAVDPADPREQGVRDPAADDRGDAHEGLGLLVEPVHPGQEQPPEVAGIGPAGACRGRELLGEVGVALGPSGGVLDGAGGQVGAGPADDVLQVRLRERPEVEAGEVREPGPHGERARERMPAVDVVTAPGHEQPEPLEPSAGEQDGEQLARGLVGPVDVLDDEQQRSPSSEIRQRCVDRLDEPGPVGVAAGAQAEPRDDRGQPGVRRDELVHEVPLPGVEGGEHLDERQVGQARADLADAVADEHPAVGGRVDEAPDQGRLADAGVAAEQHGAAGAGPPERGGQPGQLTVSSDQLGRGHRGHGFDHGTGHGCRGRPVTRAPRAARAGRAG